jgi:hypothetical protein
LEISLSKELVGTVIMPNAVPFKYPGFDIRKCVNPYCLVYKLDGNTFLLEINHPITPEISAIFVNTLMKDVKPSR